VKTFLTSANGVAEAIKRGGGTLLISRKSNRASNLERLANEHGVPIRQVTERTLTKLTRNMSHRGYAMETNRKRKNSAIKPLEHIESRISDNSLVILLDGITDPRNLGAVIRVAEQFCALAVIVPKRRSAGENADTLSRTSAGAIEWVPLLEVPNIARTLDELKNMGFWVWGSGAAGTSIREISLVGRIALVMGREGEGLHRLVREKCDGLLRIPVSGRLDSLNVATAAGILLYEVRRQQEIHARG